MTCKTCGKELVKIIEKIAGKCEQHIPRDAAFDEFISEWGKKKKIEKKLTDIPHE